MISDRDSSSKAEVKNLTNSRLKLSFRKVFRKFPGLLCSLPMVPYSTDQSPSLRRSRSQSLIDGETMWSRQKWIYFPLQLQSLMNNTRAIASYVEGRLLDIKWRKKNPSIIYHNISIIYASISCGASLVILFSKFLYNTALFVRFIVPSRLQNTSGTGVNG
jgi:hypothetical protein